MSKRATIIYIGDPMCSWCWGAAPEITSLKEAYQAEFDFKIIQGGLRPGTTQVMSPRQKQFLREHWEEIQQMTGQAFRFDLLETEDFVYDTEPPARAVVAVRNIKPALEFDFFKSVQKAFYVDNQDTNLTETYLNLCEEYFIDTEAFKQEYLSRETKVRTEADFEKARMLGVLGFPTILFKVGEKHKQVARGYASFTNMQTQVEHWKQTLLG